MPNALDLTNKKIGKLTAIKKAESKNKHTYWTCKCECGNIKDIQTAHLTSGATRSCGECYESNGNSKGNHLSNAGIEKKCNLCGNFFIANTFNRQYCYECSPSGLSPKDALRYKKRLLKQKMIDYKGGKCELCGYDKCQGALEFHHKDRNEKEFELSQINLNSSIFSIEKIYKEIDKCLLLCSNCHHEQHFIDDNL